ncbi:signal peptidase I [Streptomyces sp. A3M-1-3]|uniref:signal peptidase I n=1 Tax=Streptomyces sp. A3M-1-3 TaxID=2962044 RepID=UPI0020B8181D|nr:signal peptidase I [Streptomyces sp. A3M-1-3]MCP3816694.1 signal peptidase I [Streptomyces sp. A3M-1-3]
METEAELTERDHSCDPDGEAEGSRSARLSWRKAALAGIVGAVLLLLISNSVVQPFLIPSRSMEPALQIGDRVLVNKLAYRFGAEPQRGDVVVFDGTGSFVQEEGADADFVKRVVGVGGDRVVCCDKQGRVHVNGVAVDEAYLFPGDAPSQVPFDIVVPLETLWLMGDHRSQSRDSRDHLGEPGGGMVPVEKVIGRADWIGWPFTRWASLDRPGAFSGVRPLGGAHG